MKKTQITRPPDDALRQFFPEGAAPTITVERFERQIAFILSALGEFNENYKYTYVTDLCTFKGLNINKKQLKQVSEQLGIKLTLNCKLADIAKKMFIEEAAQFSVS